MKLSAQDLFASLGRLMIGLLFLLSGIGQASAPTRTVSYIASSGLPLPTLGYGLALVVELGVGLMFILGYKARWVAILLGLFTLVTAVAFHNPWQDLNQLIHFFKNIAIAGGLFQVAVFGAGALSLDAWLAIKHTRRVRRG